VAARKWAYRSFLSFLISSVVLVGLLGVGTRSVRADSSLALDGLGTNTTCQASSCDAQLLTTSSSDDVIVLAVECGYTTCPVDISTIIDSSGLTFTQRLRYAPNDAIWEYYAVATSSLTDDNVTVVFSGSHGYPPHGIQVLAVSGADTSTIYDEDSSVPATVRCPGPDCGDCTANFNQGTCSASVQTSSLDFVVVVTSINDAGACGGYQSSSGGAPGFTTITTNKGYSGWMEVDYTITTEPQSYVEFDCNGTDAMAIVVDAIMASSSTE
jgi:hypothetical protein